MGIKFQRRLKFKNVKLQNLMDKLLEDGTPTIIDFKSIEDEEYNRFTDLRVYIQADTSDYTNKYYLFSNGETIELMRNSSEFIVIGIVPDKVLTKQDFVEVPIDAYAIKIIEQPKEKPKDIPSFLQGPGTGDMMYNIVSPFRNLSQAIESTHKTDWTTKPDPRFPSIRGIGQLQINKNKEGENNND